MNDRLLSEVFGFGRLFEAASWSEYLYSVEPKVAHTLLLLRQIATENSATDDPREIVCVAGFEVLYSRRIAYIRRWTGASARNIVRLIDSSPARAGLWPCSSSWRPISNALDLFGFDLRKLLYQRLNSVHSRRLDILLTVEDKLRSYH